MAKSTSPISYVVGSNALEVLHTCFEDMKSAGWEVYASSDGTTYSTSSDVITGFGSGAGGWNNTNAFKAAVSPNGVDHVLWQRVSGQNTLVGLYATTGFTGGSPSATRRPTSATEAKILAGDSDSDASPVGISWAPAFNATAYVITDDKPVVHSSGLGLYRSWVVFVGATGHTWLSCAIDPGMVGLNNGLFTSNNKPETMQTGWHPTERFLRLGKLWQKLGDTVKASGDGTTYSSTTNVLYHELTGANGLTTNKSWQRFQAPNGAERVWQIGDVSTQGGRAVRLKYHATNNFTGSPTGGGSTDAGTTPSATSEVVLVGGGTDASPSFGRLFRNPNGGFMHMSGDTNGSNWGFVEGPGGTRPCFGAGMWSPGVDVVAAIQASGDYGFEYTNRVWDSVAGGHVWWMTSGLPDTTGSEYPGPGTFGVHTSDYCITRKVVI